MYPELYTRHGHFALRALFTAAAAHELHAKCRIEAFQQFRVHAIRLDFDQTGHNVSLSTHTAVVHLFGGEHFTDVSEFVVSCNTSRPFHQAAHPSESDAVFPVRRRKCRADEDALLQ